MTDKTKKELAIFTLSTLAALPLLGGFGLAALGVVSW